MKRGYKLILSWLCIVALFTGLIPGGFFVNSASAAASGEIVWPNPGATNLKKIAEPVEGKKGQWKVTLTVEGKNIKTASDVVLVIDRSGSMDNSKRMDNAKTAAQKFVDNLLLKDSTTKIAVVTFDKTADVKSELVGVDKKADLTKVIKNITVSNEGTNIQAGLNKARTMLEKSSAQNKVVVLLSDGAPTYSYKASNAAAYTWPSNKYSFTLSEFSYNKVLGSGGDFGLEYWSGFTYKNETYTVNKFKVQDNGIAALSEAKLARDGGIGIYSIGLEVGNDDNAKYVLNNVQNKGYYSSNSGDLSKVFNELSGQISYAAQNAVVTDPMGAMFNKVNEPAISQGTIEWDSKTETFTWKVGNVMEGSPATLTYNVELDPKQTIDSNTAYPTNGDTILKYDDINGKKTTKYFEVPKVSFGKGSILVKGYRVNNDGQPINEDGVVVDKPEQAQELVKGYYFKDKSNNESLDINKSYDVAAPSVDSYELKVGTDPTKVSLTIGNPTPTVWFGYVQAVEQQVNVKYLEKGTNKELSSATMEKGIKGKQVQLTAKTIQGYTAEKSSDKYTFTTDKDQTYTFYYTANEQTVTVKYLEKGTNKEVSPATTAKGGTGKEVDLKAANVAGYTPEKSEAKYTFTAESGQVYTFYYTANEYKVTVKYQDESGKDVAPAQDLKGKAGDKLDVTAVEVEGYAPVKSSDVYTVTNKDNQQYVFTYKVKTYPVTVKFQDESGKELATAVKMEGAAGAKLNVTAANVEGYTPNQSSDVYTVTKEANQQYVFTYKVKTYSVVVKFQDAKGNKLAEPITLKGAAGEKLDVTAANVEDYTPDKDSDVYTVTKAANQEYVFTYTVKTYPVVVKFQDAKGNKLADPITLKGAAGEKLDVTAANVEGYTPNKDSDVYTVTKAANQEYVFTYTVKTYPVVVKFQDAKGNKLADPITLKGAAGEKLDVTAANVEGYTPDKDSDVYTVTKDANQQYVFTYTVKTYPVLVKFVDEEGKELATAVLLEGTAGEKLNVTAAEVEGYTPNKQTDVYEVTNKGNQLYVFTYTLTTYPVIVKFQDAEGNKLADPITLEGTVGQELDVTAATVEGYTPDKDSDVYTVTKEADQEYVFTYMVKTYPVLVKFVDEEGKELATAVLLEGTAGEKLNVTAAEVEGYTPDKQTDVYEVTNNSNQLYVFTYTLTTYPVIVKFQDAEGNKLADPITLEGTAGQQLDVTAANVEGYTPDKDSDVYTVTNEVGQEYVFTYTANEQPKEKRTITIKYLISGTETQLQDPTTQDGNVGEDITLEAPHFDGYTTEEYYVQYPVSEQQGQEYTFYYTKDETPDVEQRTVAIHYVDQETGETIAESTAQEGNVGETLFLTADKITYNESVYTPVIFNDDYLITENQEQEYTFYYEKGDIEGIQQVLVKFLDKESGEQIGEQIRQGRPDQMIKITPGNIKVGEVVYKPESPSSTYTFTAEENQETEIYFIKDGAPVEKDQKITVKYLDQETNTEVAAPTIKTGKVGSNISLTAASVSGYTPVKSTFVYTFGDEDGQEYIFYYTKNSPPVTPTDPNPSTPDPTPSTPSGSSSVTPLPPAPPVVAPLPPAPPKLETDNHYNYINGYPDGTIKPENNISREEVAAIFYRLMDDATRSDYIKNISAYKDVEKTRWSNKNIATMENAGIITGYPDGTFKPGRQITRAEFAAIASRFDDLDQQVNTSFSDIKGHWAEKYIVSAANKGWIKGYPDGKFKPDQYITRAEAMAFINSVLNRKVTVEGIHENAKTWPDNTQNKWYYTDVLEATNYHEYSRNTDETETWEQVKPDRVYP